MFKEPLTCIILLVLIYQLYIVYVPSSNNDALDNSEDSIDEKPSRDIVSQLPERKPMQYETPQTFEHPQLGKPDQIIQEGYLYRFSNPNPWNAIVYNPTSNLSYLFIIKLNESPTTIQKYSNMIQQWSQIIPNTKLNTQSMELIVPASDEESALAIINLILNNLKGDLTLKNIVDNKLIQVSLMKIKNYSSVRQKIIEQILDSVNQKRESFNDSVDYHEDLANTATATDSDINTNRNINESSVNKNDNPMAYEGLEFSYL